MLFKIFSPHPGLAAYIKYYSFIEGPLYNVKLKPIADGNTIEAGLVLNDVLKVKYREEKKLKGFKSYIGGISHPVEYIHANGYCHYIGIVMFPYALRYLFCEEPEIFFNHIDFCVLCKSPAEILLERLSESKTYSQKVNLLNEFFLKLLNRKKEIDNRSKLLFLKNDWILEKYRVSELSRYLGFGKRNLQRYFKETLGISPKRFLQLIRINSILTEIKQQKIPDIFDIILRYNYYDQSHFISEFKSVTQFTPNQIIQRGANKTLDYSRNIFFD